MATVTAPNSQEPISRDFTARTLTQRSSDSDFLWQDAVPGISNYCTVNLKKFIESRAVHSKAELMGRFEKFASETGLNQKSSFVCLFPRESNCRFVADLGCGAINISGMDLNDSNKMDTAPGRLELCIFISMSDVDDLSVDNSEDTMSQIPYVRLMGPIPSLLPNNNWSPLECYRGQKSNMICRTDLCLPLVDAREICAVIEAKFADLKSQNKTLEELSCVAASCFRISLMTGGVGLIGTGLNFAYSLL